MTSVTDDAYVTAADLEVAEHHAREMLTALGLDLSSPERAGTPGRMALALRELTTPHQFMPTQFTAATPGQLVLVRYIRFTSMCEQHVLPFVGVAHVGYVPQDLALSMDKVARVVDHHAGRLQAQERLTSQIADWLNTRLNPDGAGVVTTAEHTCMTLKDACAASATTTASAMRGVLRDDAATRAEFTTLAGARR